MKSAPRHEKAEPVALSSTSPTNPTRPKPCRVARRGFNLQRPVLGEDQPIPPTASRQEFLPAKTPLFAENGGRARLKPRRQAVRRYRTGHDGGPGSAV